VDAQKPGVPPAELAIGSQTRNSPHGLVSVESPRGWAQPGGQCVPRFQIEAAVECASAVNNILFAAGQPFQTRAIAKSDSPLSIHKVNWFPKKIEKTRNLTAWTLLRHHSF
jgi:hypothetical protein